MLTVATNNSKCSCRDDARHLFHFLSAGCIPVFFSTCLDPRLALEAMYPHFLVPHDRANLTAPALANLRRAHARSDGEGDAGGDGAPVAVDGESNDGFGVGTWAVLIDARGLGLLADGAGSRGRGGGVAARAI